MFNTFLNDDPFNKNNSRNIDNTSRFLYNCAGFALETFSWYLPTEPEWYESINLRHLTSKAIKKRTRKAVFQMLLDFPDMRIIHSLEELKSEEYAIAFRFAPNRDFHYMKRIEENCWLHKMGSSSCIHRVKDCDVFSEEWCGRYTGPIILFAKRGQKDFGLSILIRRNTSNFIFQKNIDFSKKYDIIK